MAWFHLTLDFNLTCSYSCLASSPDLVMSLDGESRYQHQLSRTYQQQTLKLNTWSTRAVILRKHIVNNICPGPQSWNQWATSSSSSSSSSSCWPAARRGWPALATLVARWWAMRRLSGPSLPTSAPTPHGASRPLRGACRGSRLPRQHTGSLAREAPRGLTQVGSLGLHAGLFIDWLVSPFMVLIWNSWGFKKVLPGSRWFKDTEGNSKMLEKPGGI